MAYNEDKDIFDNDREFEEEKVKEEKKPKYKPDQPEYWEQDESEWEHLKPRTRMPFWIWIVCAAAVVGLMIGCWIRYCSPVVEDSTKYGYVENIEKRGMVFKTYEGTMIPYKELMDTTRIYDRDFVFSVKDEETAAALKDAMVNHKPVRVTYKQYKATLPWRGASKIVVTAVDTVDKDKILPPEFAPKSR